MLEVKNLRKWFEIKKGIARKLYVRAVDGVSFTLNKGETLALVGESGCGKTTLGKTVLRLYEPTDGKILFNGKDITHTPHDKLMWYRRETGLIQQDPFGALPAHFTIFKILEEPLIIHKMGSKEERREAVFKALEEVKLPPEDFASKYPHMLSGGQMQRIAIARALILKPKLVVADEPVTMLDVSVRAEILSLMRELQRKFDMSLIYITHDLATTRFISDKIAIMYAGFIVEVAPIDTLLEDPAHPYSKALIKALPDPDPSNRRKLRDTPPGEPPSLITPPPGCRFHPRCPHVMDICRREEPKPVDLGEGHIVKCWLYAPERP